MNWLNTKILVTGGAGLLGSHLCEKLVELGAFVTVLDTMRTGREENLAKIPKHRLQIIKGDVCDQECVLVAMRGVEIVYHLAARMEVRKSIENPRADYVTNLEGSVVVMQEALRQKPARFIFASSCGVYGNQTTLCNEYDVTPNNPYGAAKLAAEVFGFAYRKCFDLPFTAIRLFSFFGPRLRQTVIHDLAIRLHENPEELLILGNPNTTRDFDDVENVVEVMIKIAEEEKTIGDVFNYSGRNCYTIKEVAEILLKVCGLSNKTKIKFSGSTWQGDMDRLISNNQRLSQKIRLPMKIPIEVVMKKYVDWLKETGIDLYKLGD